MKWKYEQVKNKHTEYGYQLLDREYKSNNVSLTSKDNEGYFYYSPFANLLKYKKLRKFYISNIYITKYSIVV